jgi:hypothetical protein
MKFSRFYVVAIFLGLSMLFAWVVHESIPTELLAAVDPGFDWNSEGTDLQITLADSEGQTGFVVKVKNVSNKVLSLRTRVNVKDVDHHDISERGEGTFQLFMLNSAEEKVSLHQYANVGLGAVTEKDIALDPGQEMTLNYYPLTGENDAGRIGTRGVIAGVRYYEIDPKTLGLMSGETKARQIGYVAWSNLVHLPDNQ